MPRVNVAASVALLMVLLQIPGAPVGEALGSMHPLSGFALALLALLAPTFSPPSRHRLHDSGEEQK